MDAAQTYGLSIPKQRCRIFIQTKKT